MRSFCVHDKASGFLVAIVRAHNSNEAATRFVREWGTLFQAAFPRGDFYVAK